MTTERRASVEEVARHLGVAKDSVYRWIETRSLPAHRIGLLWKFQLSEVDEWVRAGGADAHTTARQRGAPDDVALLALGFARGEPSALAVAYARRADA